jgi:hypothetical protein
LLSRTETPSRCAMQQPDLDDSCHAKACRAPLNCAPKARSWVQWIQSHEAACRNTPKVAQDAGRQATWERARLFRHQNSLYQNIQLNPKPSVDLPKPWTLN